MPYNPISTYRIQFSHKFRFVHLKKIILYLHKLGIKTIYASPIFNAVSGSEHGYDVTDPQQINPEIGTFEELRDIHKQLKNVGIGWIQDIVPNHMAFSVQNPWIKDILGKGQHSAYGDYFDIDWQHSNRSLNGKLILPFLGKPLSDAIKDGELNLICNDGIIGINYYDNTFPVNQSSLLTILDKTNEVERPKILAQLLKQLRKATNNHDFNDDAISAIALEYKNKEAVKEYIDSILVTINSDKKLLSGIINMQHYLPVYWKESDQIINYRRFFTINGLICLKIEKKTVFNQVHKTIKQLYEENLIQGLRIDHIDGMYDPGKYLSDIRELVGDETYVVTEKILEKNEYIEKNWLVQGETGYQFLGLLNKVLTNSENKNQLTNLYSRWNSDQDEDFKEILHKCKKFILSENMQGDLNNLTELFFSLKISDKQVDREKIKNAIASFLICCPVYKIYNGPSFFDSEQKKLLNFSFNQALKHFPLLREELYFVKEILLKSPSDNNDKLQKIIHFFKRCMQFTGALMAKGGEDTAYYTYNRFIAHNEVGDSPDYFGISINEFHDEMIKRQLENPLNMNATSTHDTKRGEDARGRLIAISDIPELWEKYTTHWKKINKKYKSKLNDKLVPSPNDEYFIYQSLVGSIPIDSMAGEEYKNRLEKYVIKALREGKTNSNWSVPNTKYENITSKFVRSILQKGSAFESSLTTFMQKISYLGILNSTMQVILKYTCPGIPDLYQGNEGWNFSFVDPDNRRLVDYKKYSAYLSNLSTDKNSIKNLWANSLSETFKIGLTQKLLQLRAAHADLFTKGQYIPLKTKGKHKDKIIAFARKYNETAVVTIVVKNPGSFFDDNHPVDLNSILWKETSVVFPELWSGKINNMLNEKTEYLANEIKISEVFEDHPFGIFKIKFDTNKRYSGTLLHISSLPGKYGIGDLGAEAYKFADFLKATGQQYWQMLPLNQVYKQGGYSPYNCLSAFAGNTLLISPEELLSENLIDSIPKIKIKNTNKVDFPLVSKWKENLLDKAFIRFSNMPINSLKREFELFCELEKNWLIDYAVFKCLRDEFKKPWNEWEKTYRDRDKQVIKDYIEKNSESIKRVQFAQYIFYKQWKKIKMYCSQLGISVFGDIPIYVNYDSADVWSNPELFKLKPDKKMLSVAGVPPDYFSKTGQLWGMPIFRWDVLKKNNYDWWIRRVRKNLELFDLLRLDHFRAFAAFWEVPAEEKTAVNGKWVKGPGNSLFNVLKKEFPDMPFVAEDLGHIDQPVYDLRDKYNIPGMRVLQFAFEPNIGKSVHIPHHFTTNSIVYTSTHDNNTTNGWYRNEANNQQKLILQDYLGFKPKKKNLHFSIIKMAYASVAKLAIVSMQDWLGLGSESRMNTPSTDKRNWQWRLKDNLYEKKLTEKINKWAKQYGRG